MAESASEDCRCHEVVKQTATTKQTKKIIWLRWTNTLKMHLYRLEMRMIKCIHVCRSAFCEFNFSCSELIIMSFATSNKGGSEFVLGFFFSIPRDHLCNLSLIDYADILPVANYRLAFLQIVASYWFEVFAARALDCNTFLTANCKCVEVWGTIGFLGVFFAHSGTTKIPNTRCGQSTHRKVVIGILTGKRKRLCKFFFL